MLIMRKFISKAILASSNKEKANIYWKFPPE